MAVVESGLVIGRVGTETIENNRKDKDPDMKEQRAGYERQWAPTMTGSDWKYPLC